MDDALLLIIATIVAIPVFFIMLWVFGIFPTKNNQIDGYREKGEWDCITRAEDNLYIARLFLKINTNSARTPKSHLYTKDEIDIILNDANIPMTTNQLIEKKFLNFYFASKGISGVHINIYKNRQGDEKIRFEGHLMSDGM